MTKYRPDIDGLRAIAVLLVLGFHAFPKAVPAGFIGVDVFFVISGFLITGIILQNEFSFARFYARRARRLFPALILVVGASLGFGWLYLTPGLFDALGRQVAAAALFAPNLLFWSEAGYFDSSALTKPLLHLWSLGVEEQFYLLWPVLMLAIARLRLKTQWVLLALTALSLLHCWSLQRYGLSSAAFYSPFARAWELSAGGLLATLERENRKSGTSSACVVAGLAAIVLVALFIGSESGWPNKMAVPVVAGTMLVIYFGDTSTLARLTLASPLMVFLGKISYPLYLWHWPILVFAYVKNGAPLSPTQAWLALLASTGLAIVTYLMIEEPLKKRFRLMPLARVTALALAVIGTAGLAVHLLGGLPQRLPATLQAALAYEQYDYKSDAYNPGCWLANGQDTSQLLPVCLKSGRSDVIAIWGDSHAARLSPGLREIFGADRISQLTRNGCAPLLGLGEPASPGCSEGNAAILELLRRHPPRIVILFGAWQNYPDEWNSGSGYATMLRTTIDAIKAAGVADVLVIGPAPRFDPSLPSRLLQTWLLNNSSNLPDRLGIDLAATSSIENGIERVARSSGARYMSLLKLLCSEAGCLTKIPDSTSDLLTWDYGHLTTKAAVLVARAIEQNADAMTK
ncbi:MAG: acyltransferase family protein [bacterium]|nr:acyltransferase family protein [bacterium]